MTYRREDCKYARSEECFDRSNRGFEVKGILNTGGREQCVNRTELS